MDNDKKRRMKKKEDSNDNRNNKQNTIEYKDFFKYGEWNDISILAVDSWNGYFNNRVVKKILGNFLKIIQVWENDKKEIMYISKSGEKEMAELAKQKYLTNHRFFHKILDDYYSTRPKKIERVREISQMSLKQLSNKELTSLFWETRELIGHFGAYDWVTFSFDNRILEAVDLADHIKEKPEEKNLILSLTVPEVILPTLAEDISIIKLALQTKGMNEKDIQNRFSTELKKLVENFGWLSSLIFYPLKTESDYLQQIKRLHQNNNNNNNNLQEELEEKEHFLQDIDQKMRDYIQNYKPPQKVIDGINAVRKLSEIRAVGELDCIYSLTRCRNLDQEIQQRINLSNKDYFNLYMNEVDKMLKGEEVTVDFEQRRKLDVCIRNEEGRFVQLDNGEEVYKQLKSLEKASTELKGMPGCPGKVTGKVKLIHSSQDIHNFNQGEILVAKATCVDYVMIMKKASAIVTEFGGITSHAAVVSRELGVPSVIGVKNVTSLLKDGDIIEVDANSGFIKKIK